MFSVFCCNSFLRIPQVSISFLFCARDAGSDRYIWARGQPLAGGSPSCEERYIGQRRMFVVTCCLKSVGDLLKPKTSITITTMIMMMMIMMMIIIIIMVLFKAVYKPVWHIPLLSVQWKNSWWWAEELPEKCRVSCRSKFGKWVHLVGFITTK